LNAGAAATHNTILTAAAGVAAVNAAAAEQGGVMTK